ncbi:protein C-mannosyl-transferase DPY19L1-like [Pan troglodytes]|uniref:protein C-mannosyl-transferase DPY19L1-like n=1 Tax=Pan troglodytes TaxID=9598 RepID=UPI0030139C21
MNASHTVLFGPLGKLRARSQQVSKPRECRDVDPFSDSQKKGIKYEVKRAQIVEMTIGYLRTAHIGNLLTSKFFSYKDFDTLLYTCAAEFDFMEKETPLRYTKTLLFPVVLVVFVAIVRKIISDMWAVLAKQQTHIRKHQFDHGELVYHALQLLAYTALGILIMRLKLFLTPHMCVMASLICSRQLFGWLFCKVHPGAVVFAILAAMSIPGSANLQTQWNTVGEFSNLPQEFIEWIKYSTKPGKKKKSHII